MSPEQPWIGKKAPSYSPDLNPNLMTQEMRTALRVEHQKLPAKIKALDNKIDKQTAQIAEYRDAQASIKAQISEKQKEMRQLKNKKDRPVVADQITDAEQTIVAWKHEINKFEAEIAKILTPLSQNRAELKQLKERQGDIEATLGSYQPKSKPRKR